MSKNPPSQSSQMDIDEVGANKSMGQTMSSNPAQMDLPMDKAKSTFTPSTNPLGKPV